MTADQHIMQAAAYAALAYRNGDDLRGDYWTERVVQLSDQREAMQARATFDLLKGSPDHSGGDLIASIRERAATLPDGPL